MFDFKRVTKIYIQILTSAAVLVTIYAALAFNLSGAITMLLTAGGASVFTTLLYYMKLDEQKKAMAVSLIPIILCSIFGIVSNELGTQLTVILGLMILSSLFFNFNVIKANFIYINVLYPIILAFKPECIETKVELTTFITNWVGLDFSILGLYFLIRFSRNYLMVAESKTKECLEMVESIQSATKEISSHITETYADMEGISERNHYIVESYQQLEQDTKKKSISLQQFMDLIEEGEATLKEDGYSEQSVHVLLDTLTQKMTSLSILSLKQDEAMQLINDNIQIQSDSISEMEESMKALNKANITLAQSQASTQDETELK